MKSGSKIKIVGLQSEEGQKLNGLEGVIDHYSYSRSRYAVSLPGMSDLKMVRESNVELLEEAKEEQVFAGEEEMMETLKSLGMPAQMLQNLTLSQKKQMLEMSQRQIILERAKIAAGFGVGGDANNNTTQELKDAGSYSWRDASDHVYIEVNSCSRDDVKCIVGPDSIHISNGEKKILEGPLFQNVIAKDSKWIVEEGKLTVTLKKASKMRWLMVTR